MKFCEMVGWLILASWSSDDTAAGIADYETMAQPTAQSLGTEQLQREDPVDQIRLGEDMAKGAVTERDTCLEDGHLDCPAWGKIGERHPVDGP